MTRPLRIEYEGALYHVTSRGNERKNIFFTPRDYEKFKEYVAEGSQKFHFILHCYVLMSNHYHLLIETPEKNLQKIMQYINSSYSTYINTKRRRSGHLFQGRYKAIIVDKDSYLAELSRYIHLNPVRAKMVNRPEDYANSSYRAYVTQMIDPIVNKSFILRTFAAETDKSQYLYKNFVEVGLREDLINPLDSVFGGTLLGDEDFVNEVLSNIGEFELEDEDIAHRKVLAAKSQIEVILTRLAVHFSVPLQEITRKGSYHRKVCVYLLRKYSDATNQRISEVVGGTTYTSVAKIYSRFVKELEENEELKRKIEVLERDLSFVQV